MLHVLLGVFGSRYGICSRKQGTGEMRRERMQVNAVERNTERFCVVVSACELLNSMVAAIVEAEYTDYFMLPVSPVQCRGGIDTPREKDETFHGGR